MTPDSIQANPNNFTPRKMKHTRSFESSEGSDDESNRLLSSYHPKRPRSDVNLVNYEESFKKRGLSEYLDNDDESNTLTKRLRHIDLSHPSSNIEYDQSTATSAQPNETQNINSYLGALHQERIHRHEHSLSRPTSSISPNKYGRVQPYYNQPHHNVTKQQYSLDTAYHLQRNPQYQTRLHHHQEMYLSRVDNQSENNSME